MSRRRGGSSRQPSNRQPGNPTRGPPPQRDQRSTTDKLREDIPWKTAILVGAVAFVVGMGATIGLLAVDASLSDTTDSSNVDESSGDNADDDSNGPSFLDIVGWFYFNTHFVDVEGEDGTTSESLDLLEFVLEEADNTLPMFLYRLIPPSVLVAAGFVICERAETARIELPSVVIGSTVIAGYLLIVFFGTLIFSWSTAENGQTVEIGVPLIDGLLIAGIVYPLVFGGIGGYLSGTRTNTSRPRR